MTGLVTVGETPLRLSPPGARRFETATEAEVHADGTESSVAVAAGVLGIEAAWVSKLPDTAPGRRVVSELAQHGLETAVTWVPPDAGRVGLTFHEAAAPPRTPGTWQDRAGTAAATLEPGDVPMELVRDADALFAGASTAALSASARETVEAVLRAGGGAGARTALALDHQPGLAEPGHLQQTARALFEHVDVLVAHEDVVREVLGRSGQSRELATGLLAAHDLGMVVVTRRDHGAVLMADAPGTNVVHEQAAVETEAVDESGSQAAFVGGFLGRLLTGGDPSTALDYGVALGALARTVPGPLVGVEKDAVERIVGELRGAAR